MRITRNRCPNNFRLTSVRWKVSSSRPLRHVHDIWPFLLNYRFFKIYYSRFTSMHIWILLNLGLHFSELCLRRFDFSGDEPNSLYSELSSDSDKARFRLSLRLWVCLPVKNFVTTRNFGAKKKVISSFQKVYLLFYRFLTKTMTGISFFYEWTFRLLHKCLQYVVNDLIKNYSHL